MSGSGVTRSRTWVLGEEMVCILPTGPFEVDGIRYYPAYPTVDCVRPMIELLQDDCPVDEDSDRVQMFCSDPPTEEELDLFVTLGVPPVI